MEHKDYEDSPVLRIALGKLDMHRSAKFFDKSSIPWIVRVTTTQKRLDELDGKIAELSGANHGG